MQTQEITLSQKQAEAWYYLNNDPKAFDVFYGGAAGGGKTWLGCLWQIYRRLNYPGTRGMIGRETLKDLKDTTLMTFFKIANEIYQLSTFDYKYKQNTGRIEFANGSLIFLKELKFYPSDPEFTDLGGLEITDAFVDEIPEITEKASEILRSRIRYQLIDDVPKFLGAGNPQNNWVKHRYILDKMNNPVKLKAFQRVVKASLKDNPDQKFREIYERNLQELNPYDRARLLYGDWTVQMNESPFFPSFEKTMVVEGLTIDHDFPVWLSFDFNIDPCTVIIAQDVGNEIRIIQDLQVKGNTKQLCETLLDSIDYPPLGFLVTGDYSGNTGSTSAGRLPHGVFNTDYEIIKSVLKIGDGSLRWTRRANERHELSYRLCDAFFTHIPFKIDARCLATINDLEIAQRTEKGKLRKDRENFKMDAGDAFRYLVSALFEGKYENIKNYANRIKAKS